MYVPDLSAAVPGTQYQVHTTADYIMCANTILVYTTYNASTTYTPAYTEYIVSYLVVRTAVS